MSLKTVYRHWNTDPVRGREVDINMDKIVGFINDLLSGTEAFTTLKVSTLPEYANNAAAVSGGLAAGDLYRTGGDPDAVCVVH